MSTLHRTQVYIDKNQIRRLKLAESKKHQAVSELIRTAIEVFLASEDKQIDWENDPLTQAAGRLTLKVSDASEEHDHYLYGTPKKKSKDFPKK